MPDSRKRFDDDVADQFLDYILDHHNIQAVAWGIKQIEVDGEVRHFPAITRKQRVDKL